MILQVKNLTKVIKGTTILNDVSFSINKNEVVSIIGHSGAGKTTILRCLNGLTNIDSGEIQIDDLIITNELTPEVKNKLHESIGLVFQNFNLFPHLSVIENITIALTIKKELCKETIYEKARKWLTILKLDEKENLYPFQLSGGEKQRVALARACMLNPKVICFDEPTSALDPLLTTSVANIIRDLAKENISVLIITHDMSFAKLASDRIIELEKGNITKNIDAKEYFI